MVIQQTPRVVPGGVHEGKQRSVPIPLPQEAEEEEEEEYQPGEKKFDLGMINCTNY
jgi:hypothetical protein